MAQTLDPIIAETSIDPSDFESPAKAIAPSAKKVGAKIYAEEDEVESLVKGIVNNVLLSTTQPAEILRSNARFTIFPIKHTELWDHYKKAQASFWTAEEVDLAADRKQWDENLSDDERFFISNILAFFAQADGVVLENLAARFINDVEVPEARAFFSFQMAMETVHAEVYSLLIDTYITDTEKKAELFHGMDAIPCVQKKAAWAQHWLSSERTFGERLVAFACVEGIGFSGSFCAIYWLKKRGLMPGLTFSNELIARDEGCHRDFACSLLDHLDAMGLERPADATICKIVKEAVENEAEFVCSALPVSLIGMNKDLMNTYIEFVADHLLGQMGVEKIYNAKNPFDWMELISLNGKDNFFEKRVGEYQKAGVMQGSKAHHTFSVDEDF